MRNFYFQLPLTFSFLIAFTLSGIATATETVQSLQQKIETFTNSAEHQFSPSTAAKAGAYLGAAMIADESRDNEKVSESIAKALSTLNEARENAKRFQKQHADLLSLKKSAEHALAQIKIEDPLEEPNPKRLLRNANRSTNQAIKLFEAGNLNNTQQRVDEATEGDTKVIDAVLPALIDKTGSIISKAAAAGAQN